MTVLRKSPDFLILRWLAGRTCATTDQIGAACGLTSAEARSRVTWLGSMRLVASRPDPDSKLPRRVYFATAEGRRKVEG